MHLRAKLSTHLKSGKIQNSPCRLVESAFNSIKFNVVFKVPREIRKLFHYKDPIPKMMNANVIYRIYCNTCKSSYIGKTIRHLRTRVNEHKKGKGCESDTETGTSEDTSTVYNHEHQTIDGVAILHDVDYEGTKILARADNDFKLKIKEAYFIDYYRKLDHELMNIQVNSNMCYLI